MMSHHEKSAWGSLIASLLVWGFLTMRMTDSWAVVNVPPGHMIWTYLAVVALMIVAHSLIAGLLNARAKSEVGKDERDLAIAARAERVEGVVVLVAVNVLIVQALVEAALAGHALPRIDLGTLPVLFYALLTVLFLAHITNQVVTIWWYRS